MDARFKLPDGEAQKGPQVSIVRTDPRLPRPKGTRASRVVYHLFFLSDGNTLISIGQDEVRVWRAPSMPDANGPDSGRF